jgi:hypothetical protein
MGWELSHRGGYDCGIAALFCFHEPFTKFSNDDQYFKSRKTWRLYG